MGGWCKAPSRKADQVTPEECPSGQSGNRRLLKNPINLDSPTPTRRLLGDGAKPDNLPRRVSGTSPEKPPGQVGKAP
jgi:hypothetical protein